ncbi:hypothetical protein [Streptomyces violaceusniger]|uniref:hypothetical protein n=1 Tax=Streptomyces violaceusniger TaxID=68280 RepID=UPI0038241DE7
MTAGATDRGRGRPAEGDGFTTEARAVFLDAVAVGAKLTEAAAKAGVSRNVPSRYAKTNPAFAAALDEAKTTGRQIRAQSMPHGEARYNHAGCRCTVCCTQATAARSARRRATTDDPEETAQPISLTNRQPSSSPSFLLARAS